MLKLDKISIKYVKQFYSLHEVSADFHAGDKVLLLGDENSGNKFLLRVTAKIDKPLSGKIEYNDYNLKDIGYLPIVPVVFKHKSALDNILYSLKIRKVDKISAVTRIKELLSEYDCSYLLNYKMTECSDKDKYIISIIRLLVREPRLVLIDLPEDIDEQSLQLVNHLIRQSEISIIATNIENAKIEHNRILHMYNGSIV